MDQGWAGLLAGVAGLLGALIGGLAAVRGARIGAETNAAAVRQQVQDGALVAHQQWVRQERQKACLKVMDTYTALNAQVVQRRDQLRGGTALDDASMDAIQQTVMDLVGTCSHLALLGPTAIQITGGVLRDKAVSLADTMRIWNEDLPEQPEVEMNYWAQLLHEEGLEMKQAYQEFLRTSQSVLLGHAPSS
ncbi:hypothetical protein [Streptomyces platensis]|uniref:hypothetical protein n=1 Tax=Streptomyces platensis TaxID=58346 RepID=UPI002F90B0D1|nr:hypothetical protein OG962_37550 [Streptomyces platensis]